MNLETAIRQAIDELYNSEVDRHPMYSDGYNDALRHILEVMEGAVKRMEPVPKAVQVSPLAFVEMVMEKEHLVGNPIVWAQWPNKENT